MKIGVERIDEGHLEGGWRIWVKDNGLGIPEEYQNNVFQRHFRGHPDAAEGTGLGLAITEQVVVQKGGQISFDSIPGEGSTFYVDIPQRKPMGEQEGKKVP